MVKITLKYHLDVLSKCVLPAQGANPNFIDDHFRETPQQ
jgi:hypothetical protein